MNNSICLCVFTKKYIIYLISYMFEKATDSEFKVVDE